MDKLYKPYFLRLCKEALKGSFPQFKKIKLDRSDPDYDRYTGSLLYRMTMERDRCIWLLIEPGHGVSRRFFVSIGWTLKPEGTPPGLVGNEFLIYARHPIPGIEGGWLDIEQIEGSNAAGGHLIPSPWDQLLMLSFNATKSQERLVLLKCDQEAQALTEAQREAAVKVAIDDALARVQKHLPQFTDAVRNLPEAAS